MSEVLPQAELAERARPYFPYHPSEETLDGLKDRQVLSLSAPSAMGKDSVKTGILNRDGDFVEVISFTSREPQVRDNQLEQEGEAYNFYHGPKRRELLEMIAGGMAVQAVLLNSGDIYGSEPNQYKRNSINLIDVVAPQAVEFLDQRTFGKLTPVALTAPFKVWQDRFERSRASLKEPEKKERMKEAAQSVATCLDDERFIFVSNSGILGQAVGSIIALAKEDRNANQQQIAGARKTAEKMYKDLRGHLGDAIIVG